MPLRVTEVDKWTIGGGGRIRDLFPMPPWLILLTRFLFWWVRHWKVTCLLGLYVFWTIWASKWFGLGAVILVVMAWWSIAIYRVGQGCSPADLKNALRALRYAARVRRRWTVACESSGLTDKRDGHSPRLRKIKANPSGVSAEVRVGQVGHTSGDLVAVSETIAAVMSADAINVEQHAPGLASLSLSWGDPTSRVLSLVELPEPTASGYVAFGLDADGLPTEIGLTTSTLCVGESGSGKSNLVWALLAGLNQLQLPYRLRVIDPAGGVELSRLDGALHTRYYVDKAKDADDLIKQARDSMHARLADMKKQSVRMHTATEAEPIDITIIDELLLCGEQLKQGAISPLGEILSVGRKANYVVWALSQLSQVDALGRLRDLFPQRIALATKSREMTEAVLGPQAEAMGAKCSKISRKMPGQGYLYVDGTKGYRKFRVVKIEDSEADQIARGELPAEMAARQLEKVAHQNRLTKQKTAVYRLYDNMDNLLYVGITNNPNIRLSEHAAEKPWWSVVDQTKTQIVWYKNRPQAKAEETKAILTEHPKYNVDEVVPA